MLIFPAIDILEGKAVRLLNGDYSNVTVYGDDPAQIGADFALLGASCIHIVDLDGAREGGTPNFDTVIKIKKRSGLFCEVGGGIRSLEVMDKYLSAGIDRIILGTAAAKDRELLRKAAKLLGKRLAVGVDIKDGAVLINGWTEKTEIRAFDFVEELLETGVSNIICTDISRDGAMRGANRELYKEISERFKINITASGGISTAEELKELKKMGIYAAIIGKAYYTGAIDLKEAVRIGKE